MINAQANTTEQELKDRINWHSEGLKKLNFKNYNPSFHSGFQNNIRILQELANHYSEFRASEFLQDKITAYQFKLDTCRDKSVMMKSISVHSGKLARMKIDEASKGNLATWGESIQTLIGHTVKDVGLMSNPNKYVDQVNGYMDVYSGLSK